MNRWWVGEWFIWWWWFIRTSFCVFNFFRSQSRHISFSFFFFFFFYYRLVLCNRAHHPSLSVKIFPTYLFISFIISLFFFLLLLFFFPDFHVWKVYTCRYCRLNAGVFLFICIFLKPVFLLVSAIVVIVLIMLSLVKFLSKKLLSWTGNTDKLTYHDRCVALFSNLIGWRTGCYTVQLSCRIDSLEMLFGYWFLKQFNPLNQLKLRTYVLTEKIYFSLFWGNFVKSISYINLYIFFGN